MKVITSLTHLTTGEGHRIAFTYSEIVEEGNIVSQNNKGNYVTMKSAVIKAIGTIEADIQTHLGE